MKISHLIFTHFILGKSISKLKLKKKNYTYGDITYLVYYCYVRVDSFTPSWQFMTKLRIINLMKISSKYYINIHSFVQFMNEDTCSWRPSEFLKLIQLGRVIDTVQCLDLCSMLSQQDLCILMMLLSSPPAPQRSTLCLKL